MPLTSTERPKIPIKNKLRSLIGNTVSYFRPEVFLGVLLVFSAILAFLKSATGFYIICGVFIVGYFSERIIRILRKKDGQ